jgi:hypothetical protein
VGNKNSDGAATQFAAFPVQEEAGKKRLLIIKKIVCFCLLKLLHLNI